MVPQQPPDDGYDRFPDQHHPPHGQPLGYQAPLDQISSDPPPNGCLIAFLVAVGFLVTLGAVTIGSILLSMVAQPGWQGGRVQIATPILVTAYGLVCVAGILAAVFTIRRPGRKSLGRWCLIGVLLGLGMGALLGGICFAASVR